MAVSIAAIMSTLSAQTSPLDQAIIKKEEKTKKQTSVTTKNKLDGKKNVENNSDNKSPSKEENKILETIAKYPEIVTQILQEGVQKKQAEQKMNWAKNIKEHLPAIKEGAIHFGSTEDADVAVLIIIDFLCQHCQTHLKMISDIRKKNSNIKFIVYSVPLFQGDLTREYGLILNAAYRKDAIRFLDLLEVYTDNKPSKDALLQKVQEFKIDIQRSEYSDLSAYDKNSNIMANINLQYVPISFVLINDKKGDIIVAPLNITDADSLLKTIKEVESMSSEERAEIKQKLNQF